MSFMKSFLKLTRGAIPESLIRSALNKKLEGIAEILQFRIDPNQNTIRLKAQLAGEDALLSIYVEKYQFRREGRQAWIQISQVRSDQPWLEKGLQKFVVGKSFQIPEDKVDLVDGFLG